MKRERFERIERQFAPSDELVEQVLAKAEKLSAGEVTEKPMEGGIFMKNNIIRKKRTIPIVTAAASLVLVFCGAACFGKMGTEKPEVSPHENASESMTVTQKQEEQAENKEKESTADKTESKQASSSAGEPKDESETKSREWVFLTEEGKDAAWHPDAGEDGSAEAAVRNIDAEVYTNFELDGRGYHYVTGKGENYSELYEDYTFNRNIPNDSYIGEYLAHIDMVPWFGDVELTKGAEVYSLRNIDSDHLLAVKFDGSELYYLYAADSFAADSFESFTEAVQLRAVTFGGECVNRSQTYHASREQYLMIDDSTEFNELVFSLSGELVSQPTGEMAWQTFLDVPLFGGSLSFKWYADGYVTVNAFGNEATYNIGADAAGQIIDHISANGHTI